jgi:hypothetical protein
MQTTIDNSPRALRAVFAAVAIAVAGSAAAIDKAVPSDQERQLHDQVINNALSLTQRVRAAVENFRLRNAAYPGSSADIGLDPNSWASGDIRSVSVGSNGMIEIRLGASSGVEDGVIRMTPTDSSTSGQLAVAWACTSPNYSTIADATAGFCEYSKLP